jgi:pantetheine-phosphate adenylyltransferase
LRTAVYPGGFDPVTNGHVDIARRAASLFDKVIVAVVNSRSGQTLFTVEQRVEMFREAVKDLDAVEVMPFQGLTVDFAREVGARFLVRGIRAVTGFEAEMDMALMNRKMAPEIESVYLMASLKYLFLSASRIREVASWGQDVSDLVPPAVAAALREKFPATR